jgi:hypothetical protein
MRAHFWRNRDLLLALSNVRHGAAEAVFPVAEKGVNQTYRRGCGNAGRRSTLRIYEWPASNRIVPMPVGRRERQAIRGGWRKCA